MIKQLMKHLRRMRESRYHVVYHHDSPGVKVMVRRNVVQRWLYPGDFAGMTEKVLKHFLYHRRKVGTSWPARPG